MCHHGPRVQRGAAAPHSFAPPPHSLARPCPTRPPARPPARRLSPRHTRHGAARPTHPPAAAGCAADAPSSAGRRAAADAPDTVDVRRRSCADVSPTSTPPLLLPLLPSSSHAAVGGSPDASRLAPASPPLLPPPPLLLLSLYPPSPLFGQLCSASTRPPAMAPATASVAAVVAAVAVAVAVAAGRLVDGTTIAAAGAAAGATAPRLLPLLAIDHFALVNADTDTVVRRLADGDTVGRGCYAFNIVAGWAAPVAGGAAATGGGGGGGDTGHGRVGQCGGDRRPGVAPNVTYTSPFWHTEKYAPYALGKDTAGDYWALRRLPLGPTTIRAFVGGDRHLVTAVNVTVVAPVCGE